MQYASLLRLASSSLTAWFSEASRGCQARLPRCRSVVSTLSPWSAVLTILALLAAPLLTAPLLAAPLLAGPSEPSPAEEVERVPVRPSTPDGPSSLRPLASEASRAASARFATDWSPLEARIEEARHRENAPEPRVAARAQALGEPWQVFNPRTGQGHMTLEEATAAAIAGDTLRIEADALGVGRITFDKNLTLEGANGDETLYATEPTGSTGDDRAWFLVEDGVHLEVQDLGFDGNEFAIYQAFRHRGTGSFRRARFRDIRFEPNGPLYQGTAIVAFGGRVDVLDSAFSLIGRVGVLYFGDAADGSLAAGNLYVGKGDGDFLDYAVEVGAGASVALWNNRVLDCRGVVGGGGSGAQSAAFLVTTFSGAGTEALVRENDLEANGIGIGVGFDATDSSTVSAAFNRIVNSAVVGVRQESTVPMPAERNWWGCNGGLGSPGCDAANDGAGMLDTDPWLVLRTVAIGPHMPTGASTLVGADLTWDSNGVRTRIDGTVPDGIPAALEGGLLGLGSVSPSESATIDGRAPAVYGADLVPGMDQVSSTVDNETVILDVLLEEALFFDGFESGTTSGWSSTVP